MFIMYILQLFGANFLFKPVVGSLLMSVPCHGVLLYSLEQQIFSETNYHKGTQPAWTLDKPCQRTNKQQILIG